MGWQPACKHLHGTHCDKIGGKCVELRFFGRHDCLMRGSDDSGKPVRPQTVKLGDPPVPPTMPPSRRIKESAPLSKDDIFHPVCNTCSKPWGKCKHSKAFNNVKE